jgi:hypothetical protein
MVAREPRARGYSLTGVRSSMLADFGMPSAILPYTSGAGFPHPAGAVDLSRLCSLTGVLSVMAC